MAFAVGIPGVRTMVYFQSISSVVGLTFSLTAIEFKTSWSFASGMRTPLFLRDVPETSGVLEIVIDLHPMRSMSDSNCDCD